MQVLSAVTSGGIAAQATSIQHELERLKWGQQGARELDVVVTWVHVCPQPKIVVAMSAIVQIEANERDRLTVREVDLEGVGDQLQRAAVSLPDLEGEMHDAAIIAHEVVGRLRHRRAGELLWAAGKREHLGTAAAAARRQA
jgi:hypothetical protein